MADRIKGITIELDGDTTKLSNALKGVNKEIRDTQSNLKDVNKERPQNKWYKFNTLSELIFESFSMLFRIRAGVLCSSIS